jgi:hypothetical protein
MLVRKGYFPTNTLEMCDTSWLGIHFFLEAGTGGEVAFVLPFPLPLAGGIAVDATAAGGLLGWTLSGAFGVLLGWTLSGSPALAGGPDLAGGSSCDCPALPCVAGDFGAGGSSGGVPGSGGVTGILLKNGGSTGPTGSGVSGIFLKTGGSALAGASDSAGGHAACGTCVAGGSSFGTCVAGGSSSGTCVSGGSPPDTTVLILLGGGSTATEPTSLPASGEATRPGLVGGVVAAVAGLMTGSLT